MEMKEGLNGGGSTGVGKGIKETCRKKENQNKKFLNAE